MTQKLPSMPLFTDKFIAETVHLTNEAIGIYIRLLCFSWTKKSKPFSQPEAYKICQARLDEEKDIIDLVLKEFFQLNSTGYTHKRVKEEYDYLTEYYQKKSISGKRGADSRWNGNANGKSKASIPIPIPNNNIYDDFTVFWQELRLKKGSKKNAAKMYKRECECQHPKKLSDSYNKMVGTIQDKQFVPYVSTWLNQRRFEDEINNKPKEIVIPPETYNGIVLKRHGEFGDQIEFIDDKGNKYQKHKFKPNAKVEPIN